MLKRTEKGLFSIQHATKLHFVAIEELSTLFSETQEDYTETFYDTSAWTLAMNGFWLKQINDQVFQLKEVHSSKKR
jgi:hypothetical protein